MSKLSVITLLSKLNMSNDLVNLKSYYNTPSIFEVIKKERQEDVHSNILAWFFDDPDIRKTEVIFRFLNLILSWAEKESILIDDTFKKAVYTNSIIIDENYDVIREETIETPSYGKGSIDILIKCKCKYNNIVKNLNIIVENKVNANETKKLKNGQEMKQTQAYFDYYNSHYKNDINIYVFLKPTTTYELNNYISNNKLKEWRECNHFVVINYQEFLSNLIEPIMKIESISERTSFILKEYSKSLGKTKKYDIMCYTEEEKALLLSFYNNNKDLITAVMTVIQDDPDTPEEIKETAKDFTEARSSQSFEYSITWENQNDKDYPKIVKMPEFAKEFALYLLIKEAKNVQEINSIFQNFTQSKGLFFTDNYNLVEKYHVSELEVDGKKYYVQKDWRARDSKTKKANFPPLLDNIRTNYKDFIIKEL